MTFIARGSRALVGMIHLPPLPGATNYMGQPFDQIVEQAVQDARALHAAGFWAGIIQNTHDLPFTATAPPETVAFLSVVGWEIRRELSWPIGVNILKNDAPGALAVAAAVGAEFVRLKVYVGAMLGAEGVLAPSAAEALRTRQRLSSNTEIWADLFDRTSVPDSWTTTLEMARTVRGALPDTPVAVGGGVSLANVREALDVADVAIVGSALEEKPFTGPVSASKARALAEKAGSGLLTSSTGDSLQSRRQ